MAMAGTLGVTGLMIGGAALVVSSTPSQASTLCVAPNHKVVGCVVVATVHSKMHGVGLEVAGSKGVLTADDTVGLTVTCGEGHFVVAYQYLKRSDGVSPATLLCGP
jgi:hypothetical protein